MNDMDSRGRGFSALKSNPAVWLSVVGFGIVCLLAMVVIWFLNRKEYWQEGMLVVTGLVTVVSEFCAWEWSL